ncbi:MAG: hypothetical protein KDB26_07070 [Microthrixaceae bacterium]|nr:hypothetical protein [Microthrixaceae bacterium]
MSENTSGTLAVLKALLNQQDGDFRGTISVVGDVGRLLVDPNSRELAVTAAALAEIRERLDYEGVVNHEPARMLTGEKAAAFAGGALWATSDLIDAFTRRLGAEAQRREAFNGRDAARKMIREVGVAQGIFTPADVRVRLEELSRPISAATVSHAIRDLLESGELSRAEPPAKASGRHLYYRLMADASSETCLDAAKVALQQLLQTVDKESLQSLLHQL